MNEIWRCFLAFISIPKTNVRVIATNRTHISSFWLCWTDDLAHNCNSFDTLEDHAVTIRERDTMAQERVALDKVADYVAARIGEKRTRVPLKPVEMGGEPWPESGVQEAGGLY